MLEKYSQLCTGRSQVSDVSGVSQNQSRKCITKTRGKLNTRQTPGPSPGHRRDAKNRPYKRQDTLIDGQCANPIIRAQLPGFYEKGKGARPAHAAEIVQRVKTSYEYKGDVYHLERLPTALGALLLK